MLPLTVSWSDGPKKGLVGESTHRPVDNWPRSRGSHLGVTAPGTAGREGALAGGRAWCQDLAHSVLQGLRCHMPVSVPVAELQMGHSGWFARARGGACSEGETRCWPQSSFQRQGWGWPSCFLGSLPQAGSPASLCVFDHTSLSPELPVPLASVPLSH